jgi:hypothetical protein
MLFNFPEISNVFLLLLLLLLLRLLLLLMRPSVSYLMLL